MKKTSLIVLIVIISALLFSACTMSASTPPPVTPTTMNLSAIARQATETAIAKTPKAGETQVPEATEESLTDPTAAVSEAAEPTSTPEPAAETEETGELEVYEYAIPDSYTLHDGEFIFCLARRFNILPDDLKTYNGYESGTLLYPGDTLQIPSDSRAFIGDRALQYHPSNYTVVFGDTLYSIACLYGDVDPRSIASANDLDVDQVLTPGTVLQIP